MLDVEVYEMFLCKNPSDIKYVSSPQAPAAYNQFFNSPS